MRHANAPEDLLLFRAVVQPAHRAVAARSLDAAVGARSRRCACEPDLWVLEDAASGPGEEPVAVAATCPVGDGRRVRLDGFVVAPSLRRRGIGRRLLEDLADTMRARGVLTLVAAVPTDDAAAIMVVQRAGFRPSYVERASPDHNGRDVVWFDVEL
jgi:GNAT superfamily N-acetyltransferase